MMRGHIKGTDSTINAILATAVLYELRWKIWNCVGKIQFVMTNTVEFTEWSELLNHATIGNWDYYQWQGFDEVQCLHP